MSPITSKPVLITGANGFIASHIVYKLLQSGYKVRGTVRSVTPEKTSHLTSMPNADKNLELVTATLKTGQFDDYVKDVEYVMHTASPFSLNVKDPQEDLIKPALEGTESVLASVNKFGKNVKRVIVTSSMAAVMDEPVSGHTYTEEDWNTKSSLTRQPYYYSKTLAERKAWEMAKEQDQWDLVTINPLMVLGPSFNNSLNESPSLLTRMAKGAFPTYLNMWFGITDVRDVAAVHVAAMEKKEASGRYICCKQCVPMRHMIEIIREKYPFKKLPTISLENTVGDWIAWAGSFGQPKQVGLFVRLNIGKELAVSQAKAEKEFDITFHDIKDSLIDTYADLIKWGHLRDPNAPKPQ
eukprot:Clim_evm16s212 gene=Clim_evmTU16s212